MKVSIEKAIKEAVNKLGYNDKVMFTVEEMNEIKDESKASMFDVMFYLRFMR